MYAYRNSGRLGNRSLSTALSAGRRHRGPPNSALDSRANFLVRKHKSKRNRQCQRRKIAVATPADWTSETERPRVPPVRVRPSSSQNDRVFNKENAAVFENAQNAQILRPPDENRAANPFFFEKFPRMFWRSLDEDNRLRAQFARGDSPESRGTRRRAFRRLACFYLISTKKLYSTPECRFANRLLPPSKREAIAPRKAP